MAENDRPPTQLVTSSSTATVSISPVAGPLPITAPIFSDQDLFFPPIVAGGYARPDEDHPVYHLIGRVAAEWSHLEHVLDRIIWHLLGVTPSQAGGLTGQFMGTVPRYRAIIAELTHLKVKEPHLEKYLGRVNKLQDATHGPQEKRNRIIHDEWFADSREDQLAQFRAWPAKDLKFGINPVVRTDIEATVASILNLSERAEQLLKDISAEIKAPHTEAQS
jgi:hypothetical protein